MFGLRRDGPTAALTGTLTRDDVAPLRCALDALLTTAGPVVLDVAGLAVAFPPAVGLLPPALLAAGGWPAARLVLAGPDARFRAALRSTGTVRDVVVADDAAQAHARLDERPERVRRRLALRPGPPAPHRVHAFVDRLGADWDVPHLVADARRVSAELVAARRCPAVLTVTLGGEGLRIALRDFDGRPARVPAAVARVGRCGVGRCGVTPRSDGQVVWALLTSGASTAAPVGTSTA